MVVSVVIPTYNRARLVKEAIESVLRQTYSVQEVIVVDDGSTDETSSIVHSFGCKVSYIYQKNRGVNAARNLGVSLAVGDYIALLDSDDFWLDFKLEVQMAALRQFPHIGFVFSDFYILKNGQHRIPRGIRTWHSIQHDWDAIYGQKIASRELQGNFAMPDTRQDWELFFGDIYGPSLQEPYVLPSTAVINRAILNEKLVFPKDDPTCGDWELFSRLSHRYGSAFLDIETTLNRSHEDSVRLTRVDKKIQLARRAKMIERVWLADPEFYTQHKKAVDHTLQQVFVELSRLHTLEGQRGKAREAMNLAISTMPLHRGRDRMLAILLSIPFGCKFVQKANRLRHAIRDRKN